MDFQYPTQVELQVIAQQKLPRMMEGRIIFDDGLFPIRAVDSHLLEWEQRDLWTGLQQGRGLNGRPHQVREIGGQRFQTEPGAYGEWTSVDERELTTRRQWGQINGDFVKIDDLVAERAERLLMRRLDRIELICWTLLLTGTYSVPAPNGAIIAQDQFNTQTYAAGVPWGTSATATPLADMRAVKLKSRGSSVAFNASSKLIMNQVTANQLLTNSNANDIFGRRTSGLATINSPADLSKLFLGDDLPSVEVYDQGYFDESGVYQLYIPNNKAVLVGQRTDGSSVGEFRMTRNVNNPGMAPGAYTRVIDDVNEIPRTIVVHDGFNGGPVLYYGSAIIVMTV